VNLIAFSIPAFLVLIGFELGLARLRKRKVYRFADAVTDLGCGISSQMIGLLLVAVTFSVYVAVFDRFRVVEWEKDSIAMWLLAIIGLDFLYYWWHRFSHEWNFMWAAHVVHHQSEDYNLAVALRQAWFTGVTGTIFYLPLALLGVSPLAYAVSSAVSLLYQFWIHTELVGKLGPFEWVFNTPSHHRVHHGINPQYLDRNHGAIFIVWDRIFGTFEEERETVVYGTVKPFDSCNPIWANFQHWAHIASMARAAKRWPDKLRVWVARPDWAPAGVPVQAFENQLDGREKYQPSYGHGVLAYVLVQLALAVPTVMGILLLADDLTPLWLVAVVGVAVLGTGTWGGLLEGKSWAAPLEAVRQCLAAATFVGLSSTGPTALTSHPHWLWSASAIALAFALWVVLIGRFSHARRGG
jgi:sterol desaturase/sphingolipid hydroxylase (fatty acid hydroxylase superfamily)